MRDNSRAYTMTNPADDSTLTFDPTDNRCLCWFEELEFSAQINSEVTSRAQSHGGYQDPGYKGPGYWSTTARIIGSDYALEQARTAYMRMVHSMLGEDGGGLVEWTPQGSSERLRLSGLQLVDGGDPKRDGSSYVVQSIFSTEKPFAESASATTLDSAALTAGGGGFTISLTVPVTFTASSGGDLVISNEGDWYSYPVLQMYGPLTTPVLTNLDTGQRLAWTGSIASGDYWEVDMFAKTVTLNGGTTKITTRDASQSDWFHCAMGDTNLALSGSGYSSQTLLRALMRNSWS